MRLEDIQAIFEKHGLAKPIAKGGDKYYYKKLINNMYYLENKAEVDIKNLFPHAIIGEKSDNFEDDENAFWACEFSIPYNEKTVLTFNGKPFAICDYENKKFARILCSARQKEQIDAYLGPAFFKSAEVVTNEVLQTLIR